MQIVINYKLYSYSWTQPSWVGAHVDCKLHCLSWQCVCYTHVDCKLHCLLWQRVCHTPTHPTPLGWHREGNDMHTYTHLWIVYISLEPMDIACQNELTG